MESKLMTLSERRRPCHFHGNRLYFAPGWEEKLKEIGLVQASRWDRLEPGEQVTRSKRTNAYKVTLADGETVYFKRYLLFGKPFKYYLRPSETAVEVFSYSEMTKLNIPIAEPVALGEIRRCGSLFAACIVTRGIPETTTLEDYAVHDWTFLPQQERQKAFHAISTTVCRHIQTMHANGFFHFDPKWRNILIRQTLEKEISGLWWIDSPRGRRLPSWRREYGIVHDLSSLCRLALSFLSRSQRLRFLYAYCGPETPRKEVKKLALKINQHLQRHPPKLIKPERRKSFAHQL
ncbi:MAG: lipopolysaccharide kinase InaA family protein [Pseudomonadota bacterium]|nr:lipopolysaccharide kinase InaA family protein [Pseudomonadota bacterium]